ncbi:hypothetical protein ACH5RR_001227 [Cinchona calisaya]|uniref:Uncharacterized protein n=1 Tax=Cinchona calisaya TaxID=153742 RepID=A0ABD3B3E3_9GENT
MGLAGHGRPNLVQLPKEHSQGHQFLIWSQMFTKKRGQWQRDTGLHDGQLVFDKELCSTLIFAPIGVDANFIAIRAATLNQKKGRDTSSKESIEGPSKKNGDGKK